MLTYFIAALGWSILPAVHSNHFMIQDQLPFIQYFVAMWPQAPMWSKYRVKGQMFNYVIAESANIDQKSHN